jgi:predicted nucleic acid-binding protein
MNIYADTNFIARLYLRQFCHSEAASLMTPQGAPPVCLPLTWLLQVEVTAAWELYVFFGKQPHHPRVTPEQAAAAHADFRDDIEGGLIYRPADIEPRRLVRAVENLTLRHTAKHGCRTYDLIHVASALELKCTEFWTFDQRTMKLAEREGLNVPALLKRTAKKLVQ